MNALKLYGPPLLLALIPSFFWAPSEYSFMLMFSFAPLIVWMARREKASEAVIGLALYFLLFDLISLRWIWTIDFSAKGWLIASMALIILPFIQSFPFLAGFSMQRRFKNVYLLLSIPIYGVLLEGLNASLFLGFPWLNPSLAIGSSILQPLGVNLLGLWGAIFIFYLSNCGLALVYFKSSNLQKGVGIATIMVSVIVMFYPVQFPSNGEGSIKVMSVSPTYDPYEWKETELYEHSRNILKAIEYAKDQQVDLILFPEGYLRDFGERPLYTNDFLLNPAIRDIESACVSSGVSVLFGGITKRMYEEDEAPTVTARKIKDGLYADFLNSAILIDDSGEIQYRSKSKLVPFMERAPFLTVNESAESLKIGMNSASGSYHKDNRLKTFDWKGYVILPLICYESFSVGELSEEEIKNLDFAVSISNEAWTQSSMMAQQHASYDQCISLLLGCDLIRSVTTRNQPVSVATPLPFGSVEVYQLNI